MSEFNLESKLSLSAGVSVTMSQFDVDLPKLVNVFILRTRHNLGDPYKLPNNVRYSTQEKNKEVIWQRENNMVEGSNRGNI